MAKIHLRERYIKPVKKANGKKKDLVFNCPPVPSITGGPFDLSTDDWNALIASIGISGVPLDV